MLIAACDQYGDRKYLLNTSGVIYRSIGSENIKKMSDDQLFEKLFIEPRLIKRPFLSKSNKFFLVGFKEDKWVKELLWSFCEIWYRNKASNFKNKVR